jgi:prolyl oligopeptidase
VEVPSVTSHQVSYTSTDGTQVLMVIVSPAGAADQPRPAVLYGYGGFDVSLTPTYSASILAWVEAGGVWAVANLRGGSEEGEAWHRAGMRENKQNVFDDFHAAAEHLIETGWTTQDQLGISGGSNGGLLVGAALTQRPALYRAVVCSAPLLDMVRYEHSGLGQLWNEEYGTAADPDELAWLLGYSPYHHVEEGVGYPAVLFTVFDGDTRVDTMHARKMCAALQWATSYPPSERPILLRAERDVGHGARSVSRTVDLAADQLAFLHHELFPERI